jgi:16S rRNA C967 or C1407 C5-methylase (RsmB/RsmF family)
VISYLAPSQLTALPPPLECVLGRVSSSNMPKRQRNPLSDARKGAGIASFASVAGINGDYRIIDKTSQPNQSKSHDLWHRKSGAGYNLFISYYGCQPCGVVAHDADFEGSGDTCFSLGSSTTKNDAPNARGLSRASKKRQKKRAKSCTNKDGSGVNLLAKESGCVNRDKANDPSKAPANDPLYASHPLVKAFVSNSKYSHLNSFVCSLSTPLPLTFRLRRNGPPSSKDLEATISEEYAQYISPVSYDPSTAIFQSTPSSCLTKSNLGHIPKLKDLIVTASQDGTLARQEIGSMLPILALHSVHAITKGSKVLDLCASPGSKTLQALEIVAQDGKKGRVIANDIHSGRLDSLREAVARSGLPDCLTSRVTFTNYDASVFPPPKSGRMFDAIICDVPCSGDGTIRKDRHVLPMWSPRIGNELHGLQLKILTRALELVKMGGVICYSTCSLNPVEDEAVVAAALGALTKGVMKFEIVERPKTLLPGFVTRGGITDWKVAFYDSMKVDHDSEDFGSLTICSHAKDAEEAGIKDAAATLWPTHPQDKKLHLHRCISLLPQDNNTGGFFLALIKRIL